MKSFTFGGSSGRCGRATETVSWTLGMGLWLVFSAPQLFALNPVFYDPGTNYNSTPLYSTNLFGDELVLGGGFPLNTLQIFSVDYFLSFCNGDEKLDVFFYDNTGPNGSPGNLLRTVSFTSFLSGYAGQTTNLDLPVPERLTIAFQFSGIDADQSAGIMQCSAPPPVGSNDDYYWEKIGETWTKKYGTGQVPVRFSIFLQGFGEDPNRAAPIITRQPVGGLILRGQDMSLSATVTGTEPMSYEWRHEGSLLTEDARHQGVNSPILTLRNFQSEDEGIYVLYITNAYGSINSEPADMRMLVLPAKAANPFPSDGSILPTNRVVLSWSPSDAATLYYLYFDDRSGLALTNTSFDPGPLTPGREYSWRVDAADERGIVGGDTWKFLVTSLESGTNHLVIQECLIGEVPVLLETSVQFTNIYFSIRSQAPIRLVSLSPFGISQYRGFMPADQEWFRANLCAAAGQTFPSADRIGTLSFIGPRGWDLSGIAFEVQNLGRLPMHPTTGSVQIAFGPILATNRWILYYEGQTNHYYKLESSPSLNGNWNDRGTQQVTNATQILERIKPESASEFFRLSPAQPGE